MVLDPFSGSFTTAFVAKKLQRNFIGIELQDEYVKIGLRRLEIAKEYKGEELHQVKKNYTEEINNNQLCINF